MPVNQKSVLRKIIGMFRPRHGTFLKFKASEVICGPNDRAMIGFDTHFPKQWLVEDWNFTEDEAEWFIQQVNTNGGKS